LITAGYSIGGKFFMQNVDNFREIFVVKCDLDFLNSYTVWHPMGLPGELFISTHMLLTM
jgi:hypothetical protein